jgi:hypothetical protein
VSGRSRLKVGRPPLAPRPTIGRLARKLLRRQHRSQVGDFTAALADRPLDVVYRRMIRRALAPLQTRHGQ